jgi:methylase of polypeptide subunit release factors
MTFTEEQREFVKMQLRAHDRDTIRTSLLIDEKTDYSIKLRISRGVFGSDIIGTPQHLARYLFMNPHLYQGKFAADIGCGSGLHGIVLCQNGSKGVLFLDIDEQSLRDAVDNTVDNGYVEDEVICRTARSDLFHNLLKPGRNSIFPEPFGAIVFNHPFFCGCVDDFDYKDDYERSVLAGMLGGTGTIKRFYRDVGDYIDNDGVIITAYFHFAGPENDPENRAPEYGFKIREKHDITSTEGTQKGLISIYEITK